MKEIVNFFLVLINNLTKSVLLSGATLQFALCLGNGLPVCPVDRYEGTLRWDSLGFSVSVHFISLNAMLFFALCRVCGGGCAELESVRSQLSVPFSPAHQDCRD